ncbi:major facilitator superfamily domain-containing protein [Hysterangium stoloniferum]|nr:major facilitator superfamily domain-containing protein [Hysterangium stoloniferum]
MSERTPLLNELRNPTQSQAHDVYDRFTRPQKRLITFLVAMLGLLHYGRRPVYLVSLPLTFIGALICAGARNVSELVVGRGLQAFGAACILPVGATVISDIYQLEERGTAMGVFFGTSLFAPLVAPVLGGWLATYASWRKLAIPVPRAKATNPILVFVSLFLSPTLMAYFVAMAPLSYTLGPRYGMNSPALIGLCFLPSGFGAIAGSLVGGRLADIAIIRGRRRRQGKWFPEDRLLAAIPGSCSTYLLDLFDTRGAEAVGVSMAVKNVFGAIASSAVLPMINQFGIIATNTIMAGLAWLACILLYVTIKNGDKLRASAGMDYSGIQAVL